MIPVKMHTKPSAVFIIYTLVWMERPDPFLLGGSAARGHWGQGRRRVRETWCGPRHPGPASSPADCTSKFQRLSHSLALCPSKRPFNGRRKSLTEGFLSDSQNHSLCPAALNQCTQPSSDSTVPACALSRSHSALIYLITRGIKVEWEEKVSRTQPWVSPLLVA